MTVIVVGVDHSDGANAALRFAFEEAKLRQAKLRAVHVWQFTGHLGAPGLEGSYPGFGGELDDLRGAAEAVLDAALRQVANETDDVQVERRIVEGSPAGVLVEESRDADLLVVGSRGRGGFAGLLLGSVSQQCAYHAACPVVIVHGSDKEQGR
jgi:nucleotide-binding universal stress UspA family protein